MLCGQGWKHNAAVLLTLALCSTGIVGTAVLQQAPESSGCREIDVSGGEDVGTFGGKYLLEPARYDGRPVYKRKATTCERIETPGSRDAGRVEYMLRCDRQRTRPALLYFDAKHGMWKLGDNGLGSDIVHALAQTRASTPDAVPDSAWYVSNGPHGWRRPHGGLRAACTARSAASDAAPWCDSKHMGPMLIRPVAQANCVTCTYREMAGLTSTMLIFSCSRSATFSALTIRVRRAL